VTIQEQNKLRLQMGLPMYFGKITDKEMLELVEMNKHLNEVKFWKNTNPPCHEECVEILEDAIKDYKMLYNRLENIESKEQELHIDLIEDLALCNHRIKTFKKRLNELPKKEIECEELSLFEKIWGKVSVWNKKITDLELDKVKSLQKKIVGRNRLGLTN